MTFNPFHMHCSRFTWVFSLLVILALSCKQSENVQTTSAKQAISYDLYEDDWEEIESLENNGKGKLIIEKSNRLFVKALNENNVNQVFKSLAFRSKYVNLVEEDATYKILALFQATIDSSEFPLNQLLNSAIAELYVQYLEQNRFRINQRSKIKGSEPDDLRSWSIETILQRIDEHYQASLSDSKALKDISTELIKPILTDPKEDDLLASGLRLRPTLYDFLIDRYIHYLKTNQAGFSKEIDTFQTEAENLFADIEEFTTLRFSDNKDSSSNRLKLIGKYQEVLQSHLNEQDYRVLIDYNLDRLKYFYSTSNDHQKDSLYLNALKRLSSDYEEESLNDEVDFKIAQLYFEWGNNYRFHNNDSIYRWYLKKAHQICAEIGKKTTFVAKQAQSLQSKIEFPQLGIQLEEVYPTEEAILFRLQYKNLDSANFRLVRLPFDLYPNHEYRQYELVESLKGKTPLRKWGEKLPNPRDFQNHSVELPISSLPQGNYYLIASPTENFDSLENNELAVVNFTVSDVSVISRNRNDEGSLELLIRNRKDGSAITSAKVEVYSQKRYQSQSSNWQKINTLFPDQFGFLEIVDSDKQEQIHYIVSTERDTMAPRYSHYLSRRSDQNRGFIKTHFFSDRAIYRPGQTVYFKGIVVESNREEKEVKPEYSTEVVLLNAHGEELQTMEVKTNEYGSYKGEFVLPSKGLNGQYRIKDQHGMHFFNVEEYKRPTFKVSLDTSKEQQRINTTINLQGNVQAYSGEMIANAKVKYTVVRKPNYNYWPFQRMIIPRQEEKVISFGSTKTNSSGKFSFDFYAYAAKSSHEHYSPIYNFEINLEATNAAGESQQLLQSIQLSRQALFLEVDLKEAVNKEAFEEVVLKAVNINGEAVETTLDLELWKLRVPEKFVKPKEWEATDQQLIKKEKYETQFPLFSFTNREKMEDFPTEVLVSRSRVSTNKKLNLFRTLKSGAYEIFISTKDKNGQEVSLKKRFILYDENSAELPYPLFSWFHSVKAEGEPGEVAQILVGSSLNGLKLLYEIEHDQKIVSQEWIELNKEKKIISIPIKEVYRGNFTVHFTGAHSNRFLQYSKEIEVPYSNKKLLMSLHTFREKVEPSSEEKWILKVKPKVGSGIDSEVLLSMYDQSLDQFISKGWRFDLFGRKSSGLQWFANGFSLRSAQWSVGRSYGRSEVGQRYYPRLNWFGFSLSGNSSGYYPMMLADDNSVANEVEEMDGVKVRSNVEKKREENGAGEKKSAADIIPLRKDFRETAFFYPQLKPDENGLLSFEFKMPEALTEWKFRALAHSKDLKSGVFEKSIRTQKQLMVKPNLPRFLREEDEVEINMSVFNLSKDSISGYGRLVVLDAKNGDQIDLFIGESSDRRFNLFSNEETTLKWRIKVPRGLKALTFRLSANSDNYSDGEEHMIPVLSKRILVTESLPFFVRANESRSFSMDKLLQSTSPTLTHESFTLEVTPNPAWYAIQALPSMTDSQTESAEKLFSRLYAYCIAEHIVNSQPKIKAVFDQWRELNSEELNSKLMQNQELKAILIEETPWLREAKSESEQKKRIALLFDFNSMTYKKEEMIQKLMELQLANGGWSWYKGMKENRYITQYILEGFGKLKQLNLVQGEEVTKMIDRALGYLDQKLQQDYQRLKERKEDLSNNNLSYLPIQSMFVQSYFLNPSEEKNEALSYYLNQAEKYWMSQSIYMKGMLALTMHRFSPESKTPHFILESIEDFAIEDEEMGMYWKHQNGPYWYQSQLDAQSLMIEVFLTLSNERKTVESLKIWLLKQKQTQMWGNTKSTAKAIYALLLSGKDLLNQTTQLSIDLGNETLKIADQNTEAGTNYFKKTWQKNEVQSEFGNLTIVNPDSSMAWGAAYWQYYEDTDLISKQGTESLKLTKSYYKVIMTKKGELIQPIDSETTIMVGDQIKVRLHIESDRRYEFVQIKDMRPAALEPINTLSGMKYQDGLSYYESTKDASTNFFFDVLPKGVYEFEYDLTASQAGTYSTGISKIECAYAPEFSAHSKGEILKISSQ